MSLVLLVLLLVLVRVGTPDAPSGSDRNQEAPRAPTKSIDQFFDDPLDGAPALSVAAAQKAVAFPVTLPSHGMANEELEERAWASNEVFAVRFSTGILIIEERPQFPDSLSEFTGDLESITRSEARVGSAGGQPALIIEVKAIEDEPSRVSLQLVRGDEDPTAKDGVSITIYGRDVTDEDLISIAETFD